MEINRSNIIEIVNNSNAKPDKDYGQNFLVEPDVSKKIVSALEVKAVDTVLEIGPGLGSLTHFLASTRGALTVVDIDQRMIAFLNVVYAKHKNVAILNSDIRKFDVSKYTKIIGNLPYNITSEVIVYLLLNAVNCKKLVLMIQSDAYPHFSNISGKEYGPSSVLLHLLGSCKKLFQVKPGCFYPSPKCSSTVFEINLEENSDRDEAKDVYFFCKNIFLNRRKTILNNLQNLTKNRTFAEDLLKKCRISPSKRPEEIQPKTYLELYRSYKNIYK